MTDDDVRFMCEKIKEIEKDIKGNLTEKKDTKSQIRKNAVDKIREELDRLFDEKEKELKG